MNLLANRLAKNFVFAAICFAVTCLAAPSLFAVDWLTAPSTYTHDPMYGNRVNQYAQVGPYYYYERPDYVRSGYRHTRSTIQLGNSADNLHIVEEWGRPVRPYEEWRFPYRPYSAPYDAWGPPFGGLNVAPAVGWGGGWGPGYGGPGYGGPGYGGGNAYPNPYPRGPSPVIDGHYPTYDRNDRSPYYYSYP